MAMTVEVLLAILKLQDELGPALRRAGRAIRNPALEGLQYWKRYVRRARHIRHVRRCRTTPIFAVAR
jgi:hypothetical protein